MTDNDGSAAQDLEPELEQLGYVSTQATALSTSDLVQILKSAREHNASVGVTGLLLHREGSFFQVLEGPPSALDAVMAAIERDRRHERLDVLYREPIAKREFPDWKMGFIELDGIDVNLLPGFSDVMSGESEPRELLHELSRSRRLALLFSTLR